MVKKLIAILLSILSIGAFLLGCSPQDVQNYNWCTNLIHAIETDNLKEMETLLSEPDMEINKEGRIFLQLFFGSECSSSTPFEAAILSNNLKVMKSVLEYDGIVPFSDEFNPVCWLIHSVNDGTWEERHEIVRLMIEKGFNVDYIPESGESTLCGIGGERVVFDETNSYNPERAEAVLELYKFASERSKVDKQLDTIDGATSLHSAVAAGNLPLMKYLIEELQYSINETTNEGETPLVYTMKYILPYEGAMSNIDEVIKYYGDQGGDLSIADADGKTAFDYAMLAGNVEVAELLKISR